ncbi:transposase family protein [Pseudonocardia sp. ICBG1142]|uniref:transposase family protein n=1 Tax=Pseudonocardia sp. ICBG1142 TaxID=2846760 RepID=UPI0027DFF1E2|nr:transposase family protein [Pseudonocardia sp. ICBG1142]
MRQPGNRYPGISTSTTRSGHCPTKSVTAGLSPDQRTVNVLHSATRAIAERGNALLENTFRALRHLSLCPQRIGAITAAALVLLHTEHNRTT